MEVDLIDPFNYHLYIGGAFDISWLMQDWAEKLRDVGYKVCLKYDLLCPETKVLSSLEDNINESFRCIHLLSNDFDQDAFAEEEIQILKRKKDRYTNEAVIEMNVIFSQEGNVNIIIPNNESVDSHSIVKICEGLIKKKGDIDLHKVPKENIGIGAAFGYFYGLLRITLPGIKSKFQELQKQACLKNGVPEYMIIVPEDCKGRIDFNVKDKIQTTDMHIVTAANRAGTKRRDYKSSIQKITDEKGVHYYFAGEFSTPTLTMYEAYIYGEYGLTLRQLYQERNIFFLTIKSLLNGNSATKGTFRLLFWRNISDEGDDNFYTFLLNSVLKGISRKSNNEKNIQNTNDNYYCHEIIVNVPVHNPKAIYETSSHCLASYKVKGYCLAFVYENCFEPSNVRNGYHKDIEYIENTFTRLQFHLDLHVDLSTKELVNHLERLNDKKWDDYGCVACCIASHGRSGKISTTTSEIDISQILEHFSKDKCQDLEGKPKLFFFQCCLGEKDSLEDQSKEKIMSLFPRHPEFIISYSCLAGTLSHRSQIDGSLYLRALNECLQPNMEVTECLNQISDMTIDLEKSHQLKLEKSDQQKLEESDKKNPQKPFYINSFCKSLYL